MSLSILTALSSIATIVQILAAIKLLNATQLVNKRKLFYLFIPLHIVTSFCLINFQGKDPVGALKLCLFWRNVCVIFTVILIVSVCFSRPWSENNVIFTLVQILLRLVAIYIVSRFIKELDAAITTGVLPIHCQPPIIAGVAYAYIPPNQPQQQAPLNPDLNMAPPSYQEVMKEPPLMKQ